MLSSNICKEGNKCLEYLCCLVKHVVQADLTLINP